MLQNPEHHKKLDELIDGARDTMHDMIDDAIALDALPVRITDPDSYVLSKAIITIWGDQRNYVQPGHDRDIKNLSHFI